MWARLTRYNWQPPMQIDRDIYNTYRAEFNKRKFNDDSSISFLDAEIGWYGYMGSFNGRFFDGGYSGHNVNGRDYISEQINNTLNQVPHLLGVDWFFLTTQIYRYREKQPSIVIFLIKEQSNMPLQKISITANSTNGAGRNILKAITYSFLNIKCPMISNVSGKSR